MVPSVQNLSEGKLPIRVYKTRLWHEGCSQTASFTCSTAGSTNKDKVQHNAVLQLLCDFAYIYVKGLTQATDMSFILVFILGAALNRNPVIFS